MAKIRLDPNGGANNSCRKLVENTLIAAKSAFSFASCKTSFSKEGANNRLYASLQAALTISLQPSVPFT